MLAELDISLKLLNQLISDTIFSKAKRSGGMHRGHITGRKDNNNNSEKSNSINSST